MKDKESHVNLTVYHGTNTLIQTIDVMKGKPFKDFGRGLYVTQEYSHACNLAVRNKHFEKRRYGKECDAYVYTYSLDMVKARSFRIKEFSVADLEWIRFVLDNRRSNDKSHNYDIVTGPTANDDTALVLKSYFGGVYGDVDSERAMTIALELIEAVNLPFQIYFGSNDSTVCLVQKGSARKV